MLTGFRFHANTRLVSTTEECSKITGNLKPKITEMKPTATHGISDKEAPR